MPKKILKVIKIIIMINAGLILLTLGCSDNGGANSSSNPGTSLSGGQDTASDPLKQLQDEGKLGTAGDKGGSVLASGGPEVTSVYPPSVDPDQDNVPDVSFTGYTGKLDNCPGVYNPDQKDSDGNGIGDACQH